jgi:hypothetical protein
MKVVLATVLCAACLSCRRGAQPQPAQPKLERIAKAPEKRASGKPPPRHVGISKFASGRTMLNQSELLRGLSHIPEYGFVITGTVTNECLERLTGVFIKFDFYDRSGARVGDATDEIADLKPGEFWRFKILHGKSPYDFRLDGIYCDAGKIEHHL